MVSRTLHRVIQARMKSITPSTGSKLQRPAHEMRYSVCWFTRSCIAINTMQRAHVPGVSSRVSQVRTIILLFVSFYELLIDFVRLHTGFVPPHWRPRAAKKWDAGYDATAYFLDWIEKRCGEGTIRRLNECMKDSEYEAVIFKDVTGDDVDSMYAMYCEQLE